MRELVRELNMCMAVHGRWGIVFGLDSVLGN